MNNGELLGKTLSICPICHKRIDAFKIKIEDKVYLKKNCSEHGDFSVLIWNGPPDYLSWNHLSQNEDYVNGIIKNTKPSENNCPYDCGLCENHITGTCCVLLEVTKNCNLKCPVCYADAGYGEDVPLYKIEEWYDFLAERGKFNIQLSGGEPSLRDDLPQIIEMGRKKGFDFFQLNTNGIRLAGDKDYLLKLKDAGLNCVFLQFDSLREEAYVSIRGRNLLDIKKQAVENIGQAGIGVVLVPTVVNGVNDCDIGEIIKYAVDNMPVVRGIHFQPVSFFGRYDEKFMKEERITIPDMLRLIENQSDGIMKAEDFIGGNTESPYCSFHSGYMKQDGILKPHKSKKSGCCSTPDVARNYVAQRWSAALYDTCDACNTCDEMDSLDEFLISFEKGTLAVSCMLFQDEWNVDLERLKKCYIHVVGEKGLVPFCAHNIWRS